MSRFIALGLVVLLAIAAYVNWGEWSAFIALAIGVVPLALIWFGRDIAVRFNISGVDMGVREESSLVSSSSSTFVTMVGWGILALLLVLGIIFISSFWIVLVVAGGLGGLVFLFYARHRSEE